MTLDTDVGDHKSQQLESFAKLARHYCSLLLLSGQQWNAGSLVEIRDAVARLYAEGSALPSLLNISLSTDPDELSRLDDASEAEGLESSLRSHLHELDRYREVFDPLEDREIVVGSLSRDLIEIYTDLKDGLHLLETGSSMDEVLWSWKFSFVHHWGRHALMALRTMHEGVLS